MVGDPRLRTYGRGLRRAECRNDETRTAAVSLPQAYPGGRGGGARRYRAEPSDPRRRLSGSAASGSAARREKRGGNVHCVTQQQPRAAAGR